jgi:uncharacterized membrane protein YraQ (UPF0718 family)
VDQNLRNSLENLITRFTGILYEAMPFIVLGAVIAGILEELVPQSLLGRIMPRRKWLAIVFGSLLGLIFPMCECGIVVVMRRLLRKGLPLGCSVAYMLAGPVINLVVITSTFVAFQSHYGGYEIIVLRVVLSFVIACTTGLIVERMQERYGLAALVMPSSMPPAAAAKAGEKPVEPEPGDEYPSAPLPVDAAEKAALPRPSLWQRLSNISATALHDFMDITVFLILGAFIAALTRSFIDPENLAHWSVSYPVLAILFMMAMAIALCLCSEADAFVAASFTTLHPSAKLAFLVLGPMVDLKLYMMYTRVFRPRLIWTIFGCVALQVFVYSVITHYVWQGISPHQPTVSGAP